MVYVVMAATTIVAGMVQGITGFGSGIIMMMVLPMYFPMQQSAGMSVAITMAICLPMVIRYRKYVAAKKAILISAVFVFVCRFVILFAETINQVLMKKIFGVFLLLLASYYLFFKKDSTPKKMSLGASIVFILVSAVCDSLFGIGGPLMVIFFLSMTNSTYEYLGTLQLFFFSNAVCNTTLRFSKGILGVEHLPVIFIGMVGIALGLQVANKVVDKLKPEVVRKIIYITIAVSGVVNLLQ